MKQLENFNDIVDRIFGVLLKTFPEPTALKPKDVGVVPADLPYPSELNHPKEPTNIHGGAARSLTNDERFFVGCMTWLIHEGFIRGQSGLNGTFGSVVITEKGLHTIGALPRSVSVGAISTTVNKESVP